MHLTNFSLNKQSEKFKVAGKNFLDINCNASKQLLTNVLKKLENKFGDVTLLSKKIDEMATKTVIAIEPYLKNAYHCFISSDYSDGRCFQIIGLDVLIDEDHNCWLLEINANPSLNVYNETQVNGESEQKLSEIDLYVKSTLVANTLELVSSAPIFNKKPEEHK